MQSFLQNLPDRQYCILRTLSEMLHDRDYIIQEPFQTLIFSGFLQNRDYAGASQWYDQVTDALLIAHRNGSTDHTLKVVVSQADKLNVKTLTGHENPDRHSKEKIIIIVKMITAPCKKELLQHQYRHLEIFTEVEVYWNITKHKLLYFPHRRLGAEERDIIFKRYKLDTKKCKFYLKLIQFLNILDLKSMM